jgi:hypothetical protein
MLACFPKVLAASRVAPCIVLKNLPWRANLPGEELDQRRRRLALEPQAESRVSEQADLNGHAELIAGAALR